MQEKLENLISSPSFAFSIKEGSQPQSPLLCSTFLNMALFCCSLEDQILTHLWSLKPRLYSVFTAQKKNQKKSANKSNTKSKNFNSIHIVISIFTKLKHNFTQFSFEGLTLFYRNCVYVLCIYFFLFVPNSGKARNENESFSPLRDKVV